MQSFNKIIQVRQKSLFHPGNNESLKELNLIAKYISRHATTKFTCEIMCCIFFVDICGTFKERIKECMQREYKDAQGIIFIISEPNMDPAKKVKSTFENLNFAIFTLDNPDASKVTSLVKEASTCRYPCQYQFIFFYYYGVRGMNASGEFIRPHQEELGIEKSVIEPLRRLNIKRIFLFDYSEHSESNASYKEMNCVHDEAIAIGTEWSEVLCQKLGTSKPIVTVLNEAAEFVAQRGEENKPIVQCCLSDEVSLRKSKFNQFFKIISSNVEFFKH